jgi:hypothetical protein
LIATSLVVLALIGLFGVMPYTYHAIRDDSLRIEAPSAAEKYMDGVRRAVQAGNAIPGPIQVSLDLGRSYVTGETNQTTATLNLRASCIQPDGPKSSMFDCTVNSSLLSDGTARDLAPLESYITRQLP